MPKTLVFTAKDLPARAFYDHRQAPAVDLAAAAIRKVLAKGPVNYKLVLKAGIKAGASRTSIFKAAKRLGICRERGLWSIVGAA